MSMSVHLMFGLQAIVPAIGPAPCMVLQRAALMLHARRDLSSPLSAHSGPSHCAGDIRLYKKQLIKNMKSKMLI
jgi:hypothetical protein